MITPRKLQKWINNLNNDKMDVPILASYKMFPEKNEKIEILTIDRYLSPKAKEGFDFLLILEKQQEENKLYY